MFKSIFADTDVEQPIQPKLPHLQYNIKAREQTLKNLQNKIYFEQNLLEDKNASYVTLLMKEYKKKLTTMRLQQMEEELKIKSTDFKPIFDDDMVPDKQEAKERKVNERLGEEYFTSFIQKAKEQENVKTMLRSYTLTKGIDDRDEREGYMVRISNPQISRPTEDEDRLREAELLRINQLQKQYNMYNTLLTDIFQENEKLIEKTSDRFVCKNKRILDILGPVVLGSIDICGEEIAELIIDEMLEEAVHFMNRLEEFKEAAKEITVRTEYNHEELVTEAKKRPLPYNLMKALKALDDYADDEEDDYY